MKLKIINKPDGSGYLAEFTTDDNVKVLDRWQVTSIEFKNFCNEGDTITCSPIPTTLFSALELIKKYVHHSVSIPEIIMRRLPPLDTTAGEWKKENIKKIIV